MKDDTGDVVSSLVREYLDGNRTRGWKKGLTIWAFLRQRGATGFHGAVIARLVISSKHRRGRLVSERRKTGVDLKNIAMYPYDALSPADRVEHALESVA